MRRSRFLPLTLLVSCFCACASTHRVTRIMPPAEKDQRLCESAVFYALPETAVTADIELMRQDYEPGRCGNDKISAAKIGVKPAALVTTSGKRFAWGKVNAGSQARPDSTNVFAIEVEPKFLQRRTQLVELSEQGLLLGASTEATSQAAEVSVKLLEFAAGISGKVVGLGGEDRATECDNVANEVLRLRSAQRTLVSGAATTFVADKSALELMLAKLGEAELQLLGEFTGIPTRTLTATVRCAFAPPAKFGLDSSKSSQFMPVIEKDLLTLSKSQGVVASSPDCIVPSEFVAPANAAGTNDLAAVAVKIVDLPNPVAEAAAARQEVPRRSGGLFYRVPGQARVTMFAKGNLQQDLVTTIAQYGVVSSLPGPVVRAYTAKYDAKVYSDSGAIKTLNTSSTSVDTASLGAANAALQPVAQALVDREKAKRAAEDELAQATRQRTLLQEQERIRCLMDGKYPTCP